MYNKIAEKVQEIDMQSVNYRSYEGIQMYKQLLGFDRLPQIATIDAAYEDKFATEVDQLINETNQD